MKYSKNVCKKCWVFIAMTQSKIFIYLLSISHNNCNWIIPSSRNINIILILRSLILKPGITQLLLLRTNCPYTMWLVWFSPFHIYIKTLYYTINFIRKKLSLHNLKSLTCTIFLLHIAMAKLSFLCIVVCNILNSLDPSCLGQETVAQLY